MQLLGTPPGLSRGSILLDHIQPPQSHWPPQSSGQRCRNQRHRDQLLTHGKVSLCTHYSVSPPFVSHHRSYFIRPNTSAGWSKTKQGKIIKCQAGESSSKADIRYGYVLPPMEASKAGLERASTQTPLTQRLLLFLCQHVFWAEPISSTDVRRELHPTKRNTA